MERWKKGRTIKELSQFDDKKPEELQSEFDRFDVDNSYPNSPFKGHNIVDLDFIYKQLPDGHKACKRSNKDSKFTSNLMTFTVQIYICHMSNLMLFRTVALRAI